LLLRGDGLQGDGGVAMTATRIVEEDGDLFHWGHCYTVLMGPSKSTHHAMWKTQKLVCAQ
jgi:hypothetical protein